MRYAEELVDISEHHFPAVKDVRKSELEMARTLVKNLADTWDPSQYTDEYRENLMERLRQSLQGAGTGARKTARARKTTARPAPRKKKKAA